MFCLFAIALSLGLRAVPAAADPGDLAPSQALLGQITPTTLFDLLGYLAVLGLALGISQWRVRELKSRERELRALVDQLRGSEAALRESEARLERAEAFSSVMISHAGLDGRWLKVPPRLCEFLGYSEQELLSMRFQEATHPEDRGAHEKQTERLLRGEIPSFDLEKRYLRKDGKVVWAALNCSLVTDREGNPLHFLTFTRDITESKRMEEMLRQAQRVEAVGRLAGGVAHDFNNLITIINGYSELLLSRTNPEDLNRTYLSEIHQAGERAARLTRQLLAFSRRQVMQAQVLDLNQVLASMEKMLSRLIGEDIKLLTRFGQDLWRVKADPGQIEQVIMNLAVNARDAMPRGGRLLVETRNLQVDESYARLRDGMRAGRFVLLAVSDTGVGMDEETREHLFEPFFTTKPQGQGTGLGLATVYGIVKQSGGYIWVYSEPGRGTTFNIYLPCVETAEEPKTAARSSSGVTAGRETILLAEDEGSVRGLARHILAAHGYTVIEAKDGLEALEILCKHEGPVDLLLTDVVMPGMGGREVVMQAQTLRPGTSYLFMSGYTDDAVVLQGVFDHGTPFLHKPFTPEDLARKVREVLDGRAASRSQAPNASS